MLRITVNTRNHIGTSRFPRPEPLQLPGPVDPAALHVPTSNPDRRVTDTTAARTAHKLAGTAIPALSGVALPAGYINLLRRRQDGGVIFHYGP